MAIVEPPADWPRFGEVRFEGVELRYRSGLPLALKGLTFTAKAGRRLGVVGRTVSACAYALCFLIRFRVHPSSKQYYDLSFLFSSVVLFFSG